LKVVASRADTASLSFEWDERRALAEMAAWNALPLPVSASAWHDGCLHVRLSGAAAAVRSACRKLGGAELDRGAASRWWDSVRDQRHPFFRLGETELAAGECLWRVSVPTATPPLPPLEGDAFIAWGGAERWLRTRTPAERIRALAAAAGGHATLVRATDKSPGAFAPLGEPLMRIHRALKRAFDPDRVFNPGRLYAEL
jgi:glycolate dehydrogenase FAD-binding subunit